MASEKSDSRTSIDDKYPVSIIDLHVPCHRRVVDVLKQGLRMHFKEVTVEWTDCPDLRKFGLVAPGLCGNPAILEIGSLWYLFPRTLLDKKYHFIDILSQLDLLGQENFIIGAGKHSAPPYYNQGQLFANFMSSPKNPKGRSSEPTIRTESSVSWSLMENITYAQKVWETNPMCSIQGNFFLSEGQPGKILKVMVRRRTGLVGFVSAIQRILDLMRTKQEDLIGLGGTFIPGGIPTLHHIMPALSNSVNLYTTNQVHKWLRYPKMVGPVTAVGTIMNYGGYYRDICPTYQGNAYITKSHFHSYSQSEGVNGHYYDDYHGVSNNNVDEFYEGYFSFAEKLYVVDPSYCRYTILDNFYPPRPINEFNVLYC